MKDPLKILGPEKLADSIFMITDNIPLKEVGECYQTFDSNSLVSEIKVIVNPFGSSKMVRIVDYFVLHKP